MENKKLGKLLIILGIIIAIVPLIVISGLSFSVGNVIVPQYTGWTLFIIGIAIAIFGEYLNRK